MVPFRVVGYINFKSQKLSLRAKRSNDMSLIRKIRYQLAWDTTPFRQKGEMRYPSDLSHSFEMTTYPQILKLAHVGTRVPPFAS